jgi:hypothetical protein
MRQSSHLHTPLTNLTAYENGVHNGGASLNKYGPFKMKHLSIVTRQFMFGSENCNLSLLNGLLTQTNEHIQHLFQLDVHQDS